MQQQSSLSNSWLNRWFLILAILAVAVNLTALFSEIMEPDGALYAAIAKRMALHHDFINLIGDGGDWLDKPHFPFWITAISFKLLGITAFAYKLPALVFWLLGAFYTFRFTALIYGKHTARLATLLYLYALHLLLSNFDVRAEPYLTGLIIGSVYHLYQLQQKVHWRHLLLGSLLCACAVMTKGVFVLITISSGFLVQWILLRQWQQFTRWVWWAALLLTLLFITPELYALYNQFDEHPEKWVFGRQGVSGIHFFFWDSQFGRFFNTGPIRGSGDPLFYLHTLLWAFLPWAVLLYVALYWWIRKAVQNRKALPEFIILGTGLVTLLLFSLSKFQLPHYINIAFPFYAILVAHFLNNLTHSITIHWLARIQQGIVLILLIGIVALIWLYRPAGWWMGFIMIGVLSGISFYFFRSGGLMVAIGRCCCTMAGLGLFLNLFFFPDLLQYQAGMQAGKWLKKQGLRQVPAMVGCHSYSLEFYSAADAVRYTPSQLETALQQQDSILIFTPLDSVAVWQQRWTVKTLKQFHYFPVSRLDMRFVGQSTRATQLSTQVLAWVSTH